MTAGEVCTRDVIVTRKEESIVDAAKRMRTFHVGNLVVVERVGELRRPIGILTDRDIVLSVVAWDPAHLNYCLVNDVMTDDLVTALEADDLGAVVRKMRSHGVRRIPVVDRDGDLVGIVTLDDVARALANELDALIAVLATEHNREERMRV